MKLLPTVCLALAVMSEAGAARRIGEAQVRAGKNDLPCFTIAEREEQRGGSPDFQSITVTAGERTLWRMAMPRERTFPLSYSMCIPYGGRVQALPQTPAAALERGVVYTAQLEIRPGKNAAMPSRFVARFCLAGSRDGGVTVHPIGGRARECPSDR